VTFGSIPSLRERIREPELMDQPGLNAFRHVKALLGLERLNRWSRSDAIVWPQICRILSRRRQGIRILDVASGGGDVPIALWQRARELGHPVEIHGWDKSAVAVEHARRHAAECDAHVQFHEADALTTTFPRGFTPCESRKGQTSGYSDFG
jgi:2-polyprenyl-3-methyl-5-hydroxy-6-metoxy-1,4-benzoquinol methylase